MWQNNNVQSSLPSFCAVFGFERTSYTAVWKHVKCYVNTQRFGLSEKTTDFERCSHWMYFVRKLIHSLVTLVTFYTIITWSVLLLTRCVETYRKLLSLRHMVTRWGGSSYVCVNVRWETLWRDSSCPALFWCLIGQTEGPSVCSVSTKYLCLSHTDFSINKLHSDLINVLHRKILQYVVHFIRSFVLNCLTVWTDELNHCVLSSTQKNTHLLSFYNSSCYSYIQHIHKYFT